MLFAQGDDVLFAHERLSAGVDVDVDAQLFALFDDGVDVVERKVELVAVLRRPAAGAVEVAGARRVEQDGPGDVALVFFAHLLLDGPCKQVAFDQEGFDERVAHFGVQIHDAHDELVPVVLSLDSAFERLALGREQAVGQHRVEHAHDFLNVRLGVLGDVVDKRVQGRTLDGVGCFHTVPPSRDGAEAACQTYRGRAPGPLSVCARTERAGLRALSCRVHSDHVQMQRRACCGVAAGELLPRCCISH